MTSILFPTSDRPLGARTKQDYVPFMSDVARSSSDAADALILFKNLVEGNAGGPDSVGFMAFDAHGGDAGCQLRAGMMQETFIIHRYLFTDMPEIWTTVRIWIDESTAKLRDVHKNAKDACRQLMKHEVHPNKLGLPTPEGALRILGWDVASEVPSLTDLIHQSLKDRGIEGLELSPTLGYHLQKSKAVVSGGFSPASISSTGSGNASSVSTASTELDLESSATTPLFGPTEITDAPRTKIVEPIIEPISQSTARIRALLEQESSLTTSWDPLSIHTLARFVIFCYVLSKYKAFSILNGTVGARVAPGDAAEVSYSFIRPYTDKKKVPGKPQRTLRELSQLQSWLSDLSCAWQRSLAHRSIQPVDMQRLMMNTLQQSDKGLKAMACYPGYILARESWAATNSTLLLVDRHFCADGGFHYNVHTATMGTPTPACPCHLHPLGQAVAWTVKRTSLADLVADADSTSPHLVIMGNSVSGGHAEYMRRFAAGARPHVCAAGSPCAENDAHVEDFLAADHDRLALAFFASHKAYAFPVSEKGRAGGGGAVDPETVFVERRMDGWAEAVGVEAGAAAAARARRLKESWRISRDEADAMGTGPGGMQTFAWQHALLESKARVARRIQRWMEIGELMPLHAPVEGKE
ncbi:hypothetical protein SLS56_011219 [Neofusicoccum ribis]|uniref:Uncharacterized protein n=1 Tax=Neofusicoccum ribis TaxID=45134 RepID=A0ABR3SD59_9PEZI